MTVFPSADLIFRVHPFEFFENSGRKTIVHDVVSQKTKVSWPLNRIIRIVHPAQSKHFLIKIWRKSLQPRPQFFGDKGFQNPSKSIFGAVFLKAGCFINKSDDSNTREPT